MLFTGDLVEERCFAIFPWFPPDDVDVDGHRWIEVLARARAARPGRRRARARRRRRRRGDRGRARVHRAAPRRDRAARAPPVVRRTRSPPSSTGRSGSSIPTGHSRSGSTSARAASTRRTCARRPGAADPLWRPTGHSSASPGSISASAASTPSVEPSSPSAAARCTASSAQTARGSRRCSTSSRARSPPTRGRSCSTACRSSSETRRARSRSGIATVTQETTLVPELSVAENILLGPRKVRRWFGIDWRASRRRAAEFQKLLGAEFSVDDKVSDLPADQRQLVEIARAISMNARVLLLDEPTSSLTEAEVESLFELVRSLKSRGMTTIFVSHRMSELFALADRDHDPPRRAHGRGRRDRVIRSRPHHRADGRRDPGARRLRHELRGRASARPRSACSALSVPGHVDDATLTVGPGEAVGIAGLTGSGRTELLEAIFGMRRPSAGRHRGRRHRAPPRPDRSRDRARARLRPGRSQEPGTGPEHERHGEPDDGDDEPENAPPRPVPLTANAPRRATLAATFGIVARVDRRRVLDAQRRQPAEGRHREVDARVARASS